MLMPNSTACVHEVFRQPLQRVLGTPLVAVTYDVLACDRADFDIERPNESGGCRAVRLTFGGGTLIIEWDWREVAFRDEATAFYLAIRAQGAVQPASDETVEADASGLVPVGATPSGLWCNLTGQVLEQVAVWGWTLANGNQSPHAVRFSFPTGAAVVAIGYASAFVAGAGLGDGDEVLVLNETQWGQTQRRPSPDARLINLLTLSTDTGVGEVDP